VKSLSEHIRQLRQSLGYSQEYVSSKLEMTQQSYSKIEKFPERANLKQLKKLAEIFNVDLISLLGEQTQPMQSPENQQSGQSAPQLNINHSLIEKDQLYQQYISDLKTQIEHLKSLIAKDQPGNRPNRKSASR
jgi:transcriptional regulator with XRE-family HTH domain